MQHPLERKRKVDHSSAPRVESETYTGQNLNPYPDSPEELERLVNFARQVQVFPKMNVSEQNALLIQLENYEAFEQVTALLTWRIQNPQNVSANLFYDFLWLARIFYSGLEDMDRYIDIIRQVVAILNLSFSVVRIQFVEEIVGVENYIHQQIVFEKILHSFEEKKQQVLLLERLSLICEKKLFQESEVEPIFSKIAKLEPYNIKALRFYKLWYMQGMQWQDAADQLEKLIQASSNFHEKRRAAHELAQLYLYNLNQPNEARGLIYEYCSDHLLECRQTLTDSLERLHLYDDLLEFLNKACESIQDPIEEAELHLKQGLISLKSGKEHLAQGFFEMSISKNPNNLLTFEAYINLLMSQKNNRKLIQILERMRSSLTNEINIGSIEKLLEKMRTLTE